MEDKILKMYFENKLKQAEIAKQLCVSKSKVSRVLNKDSRYPQEKEERKIKNKEKHNEDTKKYIKNKRATQSDIEYAYIRRTTHKSC